MSKIYNETEMGMMVTLDNNTGELQAVYFHIRPGKASHVEEMADGRVFVNYNSKGQLLGVEMLAPCSIRVFDRITTGESLVNRGRIRRFMKDSVPRKMVAT